MGSDPDVRRSPSGQDQGQPIDQTGDAGGLVDLNDQLDAIFPSILELATNVQPDQFGNATPCAKFQVRDVLDHMIGGAAQFAPQLRGLPMGTPPSGLSDEDRPAVLKDVLAELLDAARSPGASDHIVNMPFGDIPGSVLLRFLTVDGMSHASDIARGTGQTYEPAEELATAVLESARQLIAPEMRDGDTFAAETPVPADSPALTKLIAFTGRPI